MGGDGNVGIFACRGSMEEVMFALGIFMQNEPVPRHVLIQDGIEGFIERAKEVLRNDDSHQ